MPQAQAATRRFRASDQFAATRHDPSGRITVFDSTSLEIVREIDHVHPDRDFQVQDGALIGIRADGLHLIIAGLEHPETLRGGYVQCGQAIAATSE